MRAARRLFARLGYPGTTIEAIAEAAGVSVPTVYAAFGSKVGILTTLVSTAASDPRVREAAQKASQEPDPIRRLRQTAHVMRLALETETELTEVLWQAGSGTKELDAAWQQMHGNRHSTLSAVLAPVMTIRAERKTFVDTAWVLGSPEVYRLLVGERGWTPAAYEAWLAESLLMWLARNKPRSLGVRR